MVAETLFEFYRECLAIGNLGDSASLGLISLIHKGKSLIRNNVLNWRPITLSNIDYKIIAKLLSNRIQTVMTQLVGKQQQGFIKGRNISNIIRGIDDILEYERCKNLNNLMFIIDFRQAFDKINTDYICIVFEKIGFGEYFISWLKTIFSNRKSCVKNGGHLSRFFNVKCGVKQGCPLAPLLFVLASEILAQNIIQDPKIKGVKYPYSNDHKKISQFADDTTFICKSILDIREILSRLKAFSLFTGLNINLKKCAIIQMGNVELLQDQIEGIDVKKEAKIVGIVFSKYKSASDINENWEGRIEKIKKIIKDWLKRKLTIIGKIQVVKTFLLSQFVCIIQSLSLKSKILDEINTLFYRFIWNKNSIDTKAWERIRRNVLCNPKEKGGLDMINLHNFQKSFLIEWACKLLKEKNGSEMSIALYTFEKIGGLSIFQSNIDIKSIKGLELISSPFWKDVLKAWIENNKPKSEITMNDALNNNRNITVNNQVIFIKNAIKNNILYLRDVIVDDRIITYKEYEEKVGSQASNLIDYVTIRTSVTKIKHKIGPENPNEIKFMEINIDEIKRKKIYQLILVEEECFCSKMWENRLGRKLNPDTWSNLYTGKKEIKLIQLQWKFLHNILPTNILLHKIGIKQSDQCDHCQEKDNVEHTFYRCERLYLFWKNISSRINNKLNKNIILNETSIVLGIEQIQDFCKQEIDFINKIIIIAKLSIIKNNMNKFPLQMIFESELKLRKLEF